MSKLTRTIEKNKKQRQARTRTKIFGTTERPRLCIFRSNKGLNLQLINDESGKTLVSVNMKELKTKGTKTEAAVEAGKLLATKAQAIGVKEAVFDRGSYQYHGRVKAVAEAARETGLKI